MNRLDPAALGRALTSPPPRIVPVAPPQSKRALKTGLRASLARERGQVHPLSGRQWRKWRKEEARKRRAEP